MFLRMIHRLAGALTLIACVFCLLMMLHVTVDVIGRTAFNHPLNGTIEIVSAWYMVALAFLPLGWITRNKGHIIVELFTGNLPHAKRTLLDLLVAIASLGYVALFIWQGIVIALEKTEIAEAWEAATGFVPVWPSRWVIVGGVALMAIYLVLHIVQYIQALRSPRDRAGDGAE